MIKVIYFNKDERIERTIQMRAEKEKKLTHEEITKMLAESTGLPYPTCSAVLKDYYDIVRKCLEAGLQVPIPRLGVFQLLYRNAFKGRMRPNVFKKGEVQMSKGRDEYNKPYFRFYWDFDRKIIEETTGNVRSRIDSKGRYHAKQGTDE